MEETPTYFLVEASALPHTVLKVARAKQLLETGAAETVNEAVKLAGISRSAFYKYRDSVLPFKNFSAERILTFHLLLMDKTGVLSRILTLFADSGANILTINQSIPTNGCASVTISAETSGLSCAVEGLLKSARAVAGVIKVEVLAG